jgi:perosamine synthetase
MAATSLRTVPIPYGRQSIDAADIAAVTSVLEGDWLTQGPAVRGFEEAIAAVCEVPYAVAFSSGTAALHATAYAADLGPGDELVTSALTFAASANCAAYVGARPVFADVEPDTWNVSAGTVGPVLTEATKCIVPVHFAGLAAPVAEIRELAPDACIVEDAAHALGATDDGVPVGSCVHSDMAVFSFHPVKAIAAGEGGMVTTRDEDLRDRLLVFRNHGIALDAASSDPNDGGWFRDQAQLGFNYRLSDIHSALGRSQLEKLERFIARRNEIAARYRTELGGVEGLEMPPAASDGDRHAYHLFIVWLAAGATARRELYDGLRKRDILPQVHYRPVYLNSWYRETYGYEPGMCVAAERYYDGCLSLPCFPALTDAEQGEVIAAVRELVSA